ncbi:MULTISPECIES: DsbA family protein [Comamonas]|uniref:DsbA family protein n=1 Tax=Comamonas TaxID=283 RepID=UPI00257DC0E1|nr:MULTISPECIES: DsbA family protein [Comamonas]
MSNTLHYIFDPLCGWCYGAGAVVAKLADLPGLQLKLWPCGMFSGAGARAMDDAFAAYAWANDQRIAQLTGQPFSELYRRQVLGDRQQRFDSGPLSLALAAVALTAPAHEVTALKSLQHARYVNGEDVTSTAHVAQCLQGLGLAQAAQCLRDGGAALQAAHTARTQQAQHWLQQLGVRGVPAFMLEHDDGRGQLLPSALLFSDPDAWMAQLQAA